MSRRLRYAFLLLVLGLLVPAAARAGDASPTTDAPADLAALVPPGSFAFVFVPSIDALQQRVHDIVAAVDPSAVEEADLDALFQQLPFADQIDHAGAMGLAVTLPQGDESPAPYLILPVTDASAAAAAAGEAGMPPPPMKGSYLRMAMGAGDVGEGEPATALTKGLPAGDLVARVDLAALVARYGDQLREGLKEMEREMPTGRARMPGMPGTEGLGAMLEGMRKALDAVLVSAERLDLAVTAKDTALDLHVHFVAKEGSPLARPPVGGGDLLAVGKGLPGDWPVQCLFSADPAQLLEWMKPLLGTWTASLPEAQRPGLEAMMEKGIEIWKTYGGHEQALAMQLGDQGIQLVQIQSAKDAKGLLDHMKQLVTGGGGDAMKAFGVTYEFTGPETLSGHDVYTMRMDFDWDKLAATSGQKMPPEAKQMVHEMMTRMFGPDGMRVRYAALPGKVVSVLGDDALLGSTLAQVDAGAAPTGALGQALQKAGPKPAFLLRVEARSFVRGVLQFVRSIMPPERRPDVPELSKGWPATLVLWASAEGRDYHGGLSTDVKAMADLVKELMRMGKSR